MSNNQTSGGKSGGDMLIAAGVVFCLGAGFCATYFLMQSKDQAPVPVAQVEGKKIISAKPTDSASAASGAKTDAPMPALGQAGETGPKKTSEILKTIAAATNKVPPSKPVPIPEYAATPENADYLPLQFSTLNSYPYEIPDAPGATLPGAAPAKIPDQVPAPIKALSGKKVALQGFMVPYKVEKGMTKSFWLVRDQSLCCYGRMPRMNELVSVMVKGGKSARFINDQPVTVFGSLEVGEKYESGEMTSLYRIEADDVAGPLDL